MSASLFTALTFPSSPFLSLSDLYRCVTTKPHAPVTPRGRGQTVACLTRLNSLRPLRKKDPRVGFHLLQPLASNRMNITHIYLHSFNLAMTHANIYTVYVVFQGSLSHTVRSESAQILRKLLSHVYWGRKDFPCKMTTEGEHKRQRYICLV